MSTSRTSPNFLFLFPDQHRPDYLPGNPDLPIRMPNVERLTRRGVSFNNAWTPSPLCAPARACLASGRDYFRCGVRNNQGNYPLEQPTYYQYLRDQGYNVGGVGKFDLNKSDFKWGIEGNKCLSEWGFTNGIDNEGKYDALISLVFSSLREFLEGSKEDAWADKLRQKSSYQPKGPYTYYLQQQGLLEAHVHDYLERQNGRPTKITPLPDDAYCDNWIGDNALRVLDEFESDRPWHLVVNFTGPHSPFDITESMQREWDGISFPPARKNDNYPEDFVQQARLKYAAMLENIDRNIGRLLDKVTQRGELDNTIIIYSSDHGDMLGDFGRFGKNIHNRASSGIPMIVAGPGIQENVVSNALVALHDLAATMVDYAGSGPMEDIDAISMRSLLEGRVAKHRDFVTAGLRDTNILWRMIIHDKWKLVESSDNGCNVLELFDLENDPFEDRNVSNLKPALVRELQDRLQKMEGNPCFDAVH